MIKVRFNFRCRSGLVLGGSSQVAVEVLVWVLGEVLV